MSGTASTLWYFGDWLSASDLHSCSLAAKGLWIELLAVAGQNKGRDYGVVLVGGQIPSVEEIARLVAAAPDEVKNLLDELERRHVFSRDRYGAIYNRRMVRAEKNRKNGKLGGNPKLLKNNKTASSVQLGSETPNGKGKGKEENLSMSDSPKKNTGNARARATLLPPDWKPTATDLAFAATLLADERVSGEVDKFGDYWRARGDGGALKRDWSATWRNWCRKAAEDGNGKHRNGGSAGTAERRENFASYAIRKNREAGQQAAKRAASQGRPEDGHRDAPTLDLLPADDGTFRG